MNDPKPYLAPGPHISGNQTTPRMMIDIIIALIPAVAASIYFFRIHAFLLIIISVAACVSAEALVERLMKRKITITDGSAVVTGILFAMVIPPALPFWMAALGSFVAICIAKELFGGLGSNIFNPALLGRAFLMAAFPTFMTTWRAPITLDVVTTATPLGLVKFSHNLDISYLNLFFGNVSGCIGETSAIALLLGAGYLFLRKVIDWRIPLSYLGTVALISFITEKASPGTYAGPLFHLLAGGLLIGAFFMATDPATSPVTKTGRWIFGIGCGVVTMVIRLWGGLPEGVMYSILLMNGLTPILNRITRPRRYGT